MPTLTEIQNQLLSSLQEYMRRPASLMISEAKKAGIQELMVEVNGSMMKEPDPLGLAITLFKALKTELDEREANGETKRGRLEGILRHTLNETIQTLGKENQTRFFQTILEMRDPMPGRIFHFLNESNSILSVARHRSEDNFYSISQQLLTLCDQRPRTDAKQKLIDYIPHFLEEKKSHSSVFSGGGFSLFSPRKSEKVAPAPQAGAGSGAATETSTSTSEATFPGEGLEMGEVKRPSPRK